MDTEDERMNKLRFSLLQLCLHIDLQVWKKPRLFFVISNFCFLKGVGRIVDKIKPYIVVNELQYFFQPFLSFLCEIAYLNERNDVIAFTLLRPKRGCLKIDATLLAYQTENENGCNKGERRHSTCKAYWLTQTSMPGGKFRCECVTSWWNAPIRPLSPQYSLFISAYCPSLNLY